MPSEAKGKAMHWSVRVRELRQSNTELLEALEEIASYGRKYNGPDKVRWMVGLAEKAIAKAEGRE